MLVLFCITYRIRGPSLHKQLKMVLGISLTGPVRVLTKHVCCHRPELRILGLLESRGLESWMEVDKPHKYRRSTFEVLPKH